MLNLPTQERWSQEYNCMCVLYVATLLPALRFYPFFCILLWFHLICTVCTFNTRGNSPNVLAFCLLFHEMNKIINGPRQLKCHLTNTQSRNLINNKVTNWQNKKKELQKKQRKSLTNSAGTLCGVAVNWPLRMLFSCIKKRVWGAAAWKISSISSY